jgi:hypothetical protein
MPSLPLTAGISSPPPGAPFGPPQMVPALLPVAMAPVDGSNLSHIFF